MNTTPITIKIDQITRDLDELRNPQNIFSPPPTDLYARIYHNLGIIKGLAKNQCT